MLALILCTAALAVFIYYLAKPYRERGNLPPGPTPLPLLGNILEFRGSKKSSFEDVNTLMKKYGDGNCVTIWGGMIPSVFINTIDGIRENFIDNQHDFASRPDLGVFEFFFGGDDDILFGKYTPEWAAKKKLGSVLLRRVIESGKLEQNVVEATDRIVAELRTKDLTEPIEISTYTTNVVYNIIISLCFGIQLSTDDPRFTELVALRSRQNNAPIGLFILNLIPGIKTIDRFLNLEYYPPYKTSKTDAMAQMDFVQRFMDEHRVEYQKRKESGGEMDDLLFAIMEEQDRAEQSGAPKVTDRSAKLIILDMFAAGTETTASTLRWFVTEMAANPELQETCAQQIRDLIGDGVPSLDDRSQLPLIEAVIQETLRLHPVAPLAIGHTTARPGAKFAGKYQVPPETLLQYNIFAAQRDPKVFKEPEKFDPYRFIEGGECVKPPGWIPFGVGRRVCLGEQLAKNDLFLVCTSLLQKLRFGPAPGATVVTSHDVSNGLVNLPVDQKFKIDMRE